ncbi:hypothetical protein [Haloarchaeobius sp. DYHT-AS-18]|uniref:hypothetical protein n=1 Tax=Haloarchaeobius sp. DYHT-AS-18 TaxID=3446117 RepID=UPI003EB93CBD
MPEDDKAGEHSVFTRRRWLAMSGAGMAGMLAGCSSGGTNTEEPTETTTEAPPTEEPTTEEPTATEEPTETNKAQVPEGEPPQDAGSYFKVDSGFADPAPWLESEDVSVYKVTEPTREALANAVNNSGPRVVVFETSGTIDLGGDWIRVTNDKLWIAGQTAPSPGITLTKGLLQLAANDCVVQHIRSRPGDEGAGGNPSELDSVDTADGTKNNIIDHCSASWSTDEVLSVGYNTENTTVSNCIVSEPLNNSLHPKGTHAYGSLTGNNAKNVAYLGNVRAHAKARNPRLKTGTESVVVNETVFDFKRAVKLDDDSYSAVVGNTYLDPEYSFEPTIRNGHVYLEDNVFRPEGTKKVSDDLEELDEPPVWPEGLEAMAAEKAHEEALANAGARPADRTAYEERIIKEVTNREPTKGYIDSQSEVGGYPELEENTRLLQAPDSDLRNWLQWHALAVEDSDISV